MPYKCNGCGGEFNALAGVLAYGNTSIAEVRSQPMVVAEHRKTLCPRCQHVLKDILMSSDLSDQWESYDWSLMRDTAYTEEYDGTENGN